MADVITGALSPLRYCPAPYLAKKGSPEFASAGFLVVNPLRGPWEAWTSYDVPVYGPEYEDQKGNITPALTYHPCAVEMTNVPTQLKLGSQAADVKALAPRGVDSEVKENMGVMQIDTLFLDRDRLLRGYYLGAFWQYMEADPNDMPNALFWTCGEVGNVALDDLSATIELTTYDEVANRKVGDVLHIICQVGARRGEKFATMRCRNEILNDGPLRADWTVQTIVLAGSTKRELLLSRGDLAISGAALDAAFDAHLTNGDVEFDGVDGGLNKYLELPLSAGEFVESGEGLTTVRVWPKISLPYTPEPGDVVNLVAGCRRIKTDCIFYNNLPNMRAQDLPGNDDLLRRTKVT